MVGLALGSWDIRREGGCGEESHGFCDYEAGPHSPLLGMLVAVRWVLYAVALASGVQAAQAMRLW